jgi:hypothetical protein
LDFGFPDRDDIPVLEGCEIHAIVLAERAGAGIKVLEQDIRTRVDDDAMRLADITVVEDYVRWTA